jgi:plastocyanin
MAGGRMRKLVIATGLVFAAQLGAVVLAAEAHRIAQKDRHFEVKEIAIAHGDSLLFTNEDPFLHQIFINSDALTYESEEQTPGETIAVKFPVSGTFEVHCHIHPKMLLVVKVQ